MEMDTCLRSSRGTVHPFSFGDGVSTALAALVARGEESACSVRGLGLMPGAGRSPGGGHGDPLQYSRLEKPMDREAWRATVRGVAQSQT